MVASGTELGEPVHVGRNSHWADGDKDRKRILIELDVTSIGVNRPIDVPLVGDLRDIVSRGCGYKQEDYGWSQEKVEKAFGPIAEKWCGQ